MLPLEGISVVDLSRNIAGPLCAMLLGDLGADVIKIERPDGGDEARNHAESGGVSPYFGSLNRNKRSLQIDLKTDRGAEVLDALLARSDVLVDNLRPGALERLGFGDDRLRTDYPRLIACHVSGFGRRGPWARAPAYDQIIQGFGGLMSLTGPPGEGGHRVGASVADFTTGLFACSAVQGALRRREHGGDGTIIEVSLLASLLNLLGYHAATYLQTGEAPVSLGNQHPYIAPYGTFPTREGRVNLCVGNDRLFARLCEAIGIAEVAGDPRFASNALRIQHRAELNACIEGALAERPAAEWIEVLREAGVPSGPVHSLAEALAHPATEALDLVLEIPDAHGGVYRQLGVPYSASGWQTEVRHPPPLAGEHTAEILAELGLDGGHAEHG